jgi:hypothetical protein
MVWLVTLQAMALLVLISAKTLLDVQAQRLPGL